MIVIKPYTITDAALTSTIAEPDTGETVWTAGSYSVGDERISTTTHKVYRSIVDNNTLDPELDSYDDNGVGANWLIVGATNRWKMFDGIVSNKSVGSGSVTVDFDLGLVADSLAIFGISNVSSIEITITDPVDGEVYNRVIDMNSNDHITGFYDYLFEPFIRKTQILVTDLLPYVNGTITVEFTGDTNSSIGELILGKSVNLGVAVYGTSFQLLDFSIVDTDQFGNFTGVTRRRFSKLIDFDVRIPKGKINYVFDQLSDLRATSAVWVGDESGGDSDATTVLGYYRNNQINIDAPSYCSATIQVQSVT